MTTRLRISREMEYARPVAVNVYSYIERNLLWEMSYIILKNGKKNLNAVK